LYTKYHSYYQATNSNQDQLIYLKFEILPYGLYFHSYLAQYCCSLLLDI